MIRNIKIHKIFNIIEIAKFMELNKYNRFKNMKIFIKTFVTIFQSSIGPRKSKCDVLNGTTQGNFYHVGY
jgi:hypothetical protein